MLLTNTNCSLSCSMPFDSNPITDTGKLSLLTCLNAATRCCPSTIQPAFFFSSIGNSRNPTEVRLSIVFLSLNFSFLSNAITMELGSRAFDFSRYIFISLICSKISGRWYPSKCPLLSLLIREIVVNFGMSLPLTTNENIAFPGFCSVLIQGADNVDMVLTPPSFLWKRYKL